MPELEEKVVNFSGVDVTLVTTTEGVVISSGPVKVPRQTCLVHIRAWAQLQTGAGATAMVPRIRRGTGITGAVVGEAHDETLKAAAAGYEPFTMEAAEGRVNQDTVEYSFTLQQVSATGDATVFQAAIEVEILGG